MDLLLIMSNISTTSSKISNDGLWRRRTSATSPESFKESSATAAVMEKSGYKEEKKVEGKQMQKRIWFAPEFDGLNCFETLVSQ